ncbi:Protein kinase PINOID [Acorus gramineus]|uniref:non-specific serine/threonine protein kinase n=1 Tax=Acorus gramineus TaxID=55184 RepID=A0AAV9BTN6_ACOGR|nr:Protein kinase PINOID [Acorus gramineus]
MTSDLSLDSDLDIGTPSETLTPSQTSSISSTSSGGGGPGADHNRCSTSGRPSFDDLLLLKPRRPPSLTASPSFKKPHRSSDLPYEAIRAAAARKPSGRLSFRDFVLLRRIGGGDIGAVYLCRLAAADDGDGFPYAMKVVDREATAAKKKTARAEAERRILRRLDHPFLPTLYADFEAPRYSCLVMEYCPGGDLHSLRHRRPGKRFSVAAARFYVAEVLLALEYLHLLGIIYRDLKPENVLIRSDGHIMLSDFDLSLESHSIPTVDSSDDDDDQPNADGPPTPTCLPFSRLLRARTTADLRRRRRRQRRFVAEPVAARSRSFVGTHEYVAPEVAAGGTHGAAVDWWALGVLLYELVHGRTPFVGPTNECTLRNIVRRTIDFPPRVHQTDGCDYSAAKDLMMGLLTKDPNKRLGSERGAADVKSHVFFKGINFALLRSHVPPVVPGRLVRSRTARSEPDRFEYF